MNPLPDTADATLAAVEAALVARRRAEADELVLAAHWADLHPADLLRAAEAERPGRERAVALGGEGTPLVCEFAAAELAVSLQRHTVAARSLMADALDLRHRLPAIWRQLTVALSVERWVARKIASATRALSAGQAAEIDRRLAPLVGTLPTARLLTQLEALVLASSEDSDARRAEAEQRRFVTFNRSADDGTRGVYARMSVADAAVLDAEVDRFARILARQRGPERPSMDVLRSEALGLLARPAAALRLLASVEPEAVDAELAEALRALDPARLVPAATLYLHVTESDFTRDAQGVARFEGQGPITLAHAREVLGHARVTIRPVIDPAAAVPVDAYEFTGSLREAVLATMPADAFPYGSCTSRTMQIDHPVPYDPGGPPGQTAIRNAAPLTAFHHRVATFAPWRRRLLAPGVMAWCTPRRRYRLVDATGTHEIPPWLGRLLFDGRPEQQAQVTSWLLTSKIRVHTIRAWTREAFVPVG